MKEFCIYCNHQMVRTETRTEIRNGVARQLTEYKCPNCGNMKVLDSPYDW